MFFDPEKRNIIFELPNTKDEKLIERYINRGYKVYIIEPFYAYHHRENYYRFFPNQLPEFVLRLINKGKLKVIEANNIDSSNIFNIAAEMGVKGTEDAYKTYIKKTNKIITFVTKTIKSENAENIFKKNLCDYLCLYYSLRLTLNRVYEYLNKEKLLIYSNVNIYMFSVLDEIIQKCEYKVILNKNIKFAYRSIFKSCFKTITSNFLITTKIAIQLFGSIFLSWLFRINKNEIQKYKYGISIVSPNRQLQGNNRGANFLIDNKNICKKDVIYFPLANLNESQINKLSELGSDYYILPKTGMFFSNSIQWGQLLFVASRFIFCRYNEIEVAALSLFSYYKWEHVLNKVSIKHFISHSDFSLTHLARNIKFKQKGIKTWYFTDSVNCGQNFMPVNQKFNMLHPYWTYLFYDNFVTWHSGLADYFNAHPGTELKTHVVGCIWCDKINKKEQRNTFNKKKVKVQIVAFDSTYTIKGMASYEEGLMFAEHIIKLSTEIENIRIIFKEKKDRTIHQVLDPKLGPELLRLYKMMEDNNRISMYGKDKASSEIIKHADIIISFPFTSTTFEALCLNKTAIWHDPLSRYIDTAYSKIEGIMTHSYKELKNTIIKYQESEKGRLKKDPFKFNKELIDPYRDGRAIERFTKLLNYDK